MGIPATAKKVRVTQTHFERITNGKIVEHGGDWDQIGLMQQLWAVPSPGQ